MPSFGQPKHKQIIIIIYTTTKFGIQSSLWVKINLDPAVKWGWLNKINVHKLYNL
jgi:hypothetical protein